MSENETKTKSISEIMESLDYVLGKLQDLDTISGAVKVLGDISNKHARVTLADELSKQINNRYWLANTAGDYLDDLEAALPKEVPTIDEDTIEDDLPFVSPVEDTEDVRV